MDAPNYLFFVATFADGTQILQNAEDRGSVEGRNCFYDVLQKQLDSPLVCFVLAGEGYPTFGVDLRDGHFEVNGVPFFQHSEPLKDFELRYFRNVSQHRTMSRDGATTDSVELGYEIGWQSGEVVRFMRVSR